MAQRGPKGEQGPVVADIFGTVDFALKPHVSPHGRVTAVSMMKDEGPFVLEWVAHHLAVGFTDLLVYTNDCSDGTDDMLIRLEELGLAHHRRNDIPEGRRPQPSALKYAQNDPLVQASDWVLVFDADEFLCIRHGDASLDGMITEAKARGANGIVITWRTFGSGGVQDWSRDLVTEQYLYAAPTMWNKGWGVKTLFQFDPEYWVLGIHRPKIKNKHLETAFPESVKWLNGSGQPMEEYFKFHGWRSIVRTVGYDWAQMNHYAVKSIDSYAMRKFRGNVNNKKDKYNADYWALQDRNEVFDDAILRHNARCKEILAALLEDPVLNRLHFAAIDRAEARLAAFKATEDYDTLVAGLKAASEVPITEVVAKPPKARDKEKIAALMSSVAAKQKPAQDAKPRSGPSGDWGSAGEIYLRGPQLRDSGNESAAAVEVFDNRGLKLAADPQIFTLQALQQVTDGKFERNAARRVPKLLQSGMTYLEVGCGVGFLPAVVAREHPDVTVIAQEDCAALRAAAARFWEMNGLPLGTNQKLAETTLFDRASAVPFPEGFKQLLAEHGCDVLVVNDPQLTETMMVEALAATGVNPQVIVLGARALGSAMDAARARTLLSEMGYHAPEEAALATGLLFVRA